MFTLITKYKTLRRDSLGCLFSYFIGKFSLVKHPVNIPGDGLAGVKDIKHFFIMVSKNLLKDVHETIMQDMSAESNPTPHE